MIVAVEVVAEPGTVYHLKSSLGTTSRIRPTAVTVTVCPPPAVVLELAVYLGDMNRVQAHGSLGTKGQQLTEVTVTVGHMFVVTVVTGAVCSRRRF